MHICMVKASKTAEANCGLTRSFYAKTNAIYRFYTYELVIDDAPTIVYGCIGQSKIWGYKVWPSNPSGTQADFYINLRRTLVLKSAENASFMLFLVSDRTNGQFWLCSTSLHNPCSSSQILDLCDVSSIVYGQVGCVDSVYGVG